MSLPARLSTLLVRMERRHWVGLGASLALHLAVLLGLRQAPPPEPEPVSFEIALEVPKPEPQARAKAKSRLTDAKARKTLAKRKPAKVKQAKREPHTLEAQWRGETKPPKDAPKLDLPDARELGIEAPVEVESKSKTATSTRGSAKDTPPQVETRQAAAQQVQSGKAAAAQSEPDLSEPGQAGATGASQSGPGGEPGIALAASPTLSRGASATIGKTSGAQGAEATSGLSASGQAASTGQGPGSLASSQGSGAGVNVAAGNGAQSRSSLESPALAGGEPQGIRLTAAGILSARANLPAGSGGLAAGPESVESGRAASSHAQGGGASLTSARAGGASANPLANPLAIPGKRAGGGAGGALAERSASQAGASKEGPAKLAGSGGQGKTSANPGQPIAKNVATKAGGAMSDRPTSRGDASGEGMTLVAGNGRLGVATASVDHIRVKATGSGPGTSQSGASLALAPGEPGSSPKLAVAMQPLVAKPGSRYGGNRGGSGAGLAGDSTGVGGAYPGTSLARSGAGEAMGGAPSGLTLANGQGGASAAPTGMRAVQGGHGTPSGGAPAQAGGGAATGSAREAGRLQTVKLADTQVMRPDSQAKPLDVLAPSTYCPLPLPGHSFPNNRPPRPDGEGATQGTTQGITQPTYAQDNPSFMFPIQAWASNIQGNAVIRVEVQPDGKPGRMWLKQSSGSAILDRDAQSQLTFWRFNPARKNGQPVTAWIDVPVVYRLQETKK